VTAKTERSQGGGGAINEKLNMKMPLSYGLGISRYVPGKLVDKLLISLDVSWFQWSDFRLDTSSASSFFPLAGGVVVLPDSTTSRRGDTTSVRLGAEYILLNKDIGAKTLTVPIRAGFFYDPEPGDDGVEDFFGFSLGLGTGVSNNLEKSIQFDIAYNFRTGTRTRLIATGIDNGESVKPEQRSRIYEHRIFTSIILIF
jgi:long-subunit fatty acid transport protein